MPDLPTREALAPYLDRIDAAHWYTNFGPLVRELEAAMETRFSDGAAVRQHVVSVSNATLGLELAILALRLPAGSRVLVPALTFIASAASVMRAGCVPVFCDVEAGTWMMSPAIADDAAKKVRFDAVMPVSTYGCPQDPEAWDEFSERTGIPVVIDAAGAYGNQQAGARCIVVYSLHATKSFAAAEGGLVVAADPDYVSRVRILSNFGIDPTLTTEAATGTGGLVHSAGTNGKLSEYHAALALAATQRWPVTSERRIAMHRRYIALLGEHCPSLSLQDRAADGVYFILSVLLPDSHRAADAWRFLAERGIETRRWYCPLLPEHPAFAGMPTTDGLRVARSLAEHLIALPFHLLLADTDALTVTQSMAEFLG